MERNTHDSKNDNPASKLFERPKRVVTLELMRKRAEHNEGLVSNLEELALHQENLEGIGHVLGRTCGKTLQILMLQNNAICSIPYGEMKWFKSLKYLNLALNNITRIEDRSLRGCECLEKLDLTLNFIHVEGLRSLTSNLAELPSFRELYMIGNPSIGVQQTNDEDNGVRHSSNLDATGREPRIMTKEDGWRYCVQYIIASIPHLEMLDGALISRSDRIRARQLLPIMEEELSNLIAERMNETIGEDKSSVNQIDSSSSTLTNHSPKERAKTCEEAAQRTLEKELEEKKRFPKPKGEVEWENDQRNIIQREKNLESEGIIRQRNEGKWHFTFDEESRPRFLLLHICIAKHLSSSLIDVDVHPTHISIIIKSKVLRLVLPTEVKAEESRAERSTTTGHLLIIMPKTKPNENVLVAKREHCGNYDESKAQDSNVFSKPNTLVKCTTRKQKQNPPLGRQILEDHHTTLSSNRSRSSTNNKETQFTKKSFINDEDLKESQSIIYNVHSNEPLLSESSDTDSDTEDPPALY